MSTQLDGVRVVDLSTYIAAPTCGKMLANMGAEVIKVESPKGDDFRVISTSYKYPEEDPDGHNWALDGLNANKKDLCINLKDPKGKEAFYKLLSTADVFLTNNRVQALKKLGLDYDTLHEMFPGLIHASILGYGEDGPLKDKPGFDYTAYFSRGGIAMSIMEKGTAPGVPLSGFGDVYAGVALCSGINAALYKKAMTGEGERVTVSLLQTAIYGLSWLMGAQDYGYELPATRRHTNSATATTYLTKDGRWVQLAMLNYDVQLPRFVKVSGADFLLEDERFNTFKNMLQHIEEMVDVLEPVFAQFTLEEWIAKLEEADIPFEIVQTVEEVVHDEHNYINDYIFTKTRPADGKTIYYSRPPVVFTERPLVKDEEGRIGRCPFLGEDSANIMRELGYSEEEVTEMIATGAIKQYDK